MIFAANLKCNHTRASFDIYSRALNEFLGKKRDDVFVFPPSIALSSMSLNFVQGVQNFYPCINGAFTGELGKEHLDEFGVSSVLIGHSERRALKEDDEFLKLKFDFARKHNYTVIFCIGESKEIKESEKTKDFLFKQLKVIDSAYEKLIIAYEPIYSIGTGISAKIDDISEILSFLNENFKAKLLYGGSVNEANIDEILSIQHCAGVLVGSASLKVENFINLIKKDKK